jgi:phosphoesterase RecJ-like protein
MSDPFQPIIETLSRAKRVLVTTHVRPDGDALGSTAALVLGLRAKGIDAEILLLSHLPRKYGFIFTENQIVHHDVEEQWPEPFPPPGFDCLAVVDTGTWSQLPGLEERIETWAAPKLVIDHHLTQEKWGDHRLVITQAAAAGEVVGELLQRWGVPLTPAIATCLYLATVSDTGWFQFANTRPYTLRLAADWMEAGVDTDRLYQLLYQNERAQRIALQTRGLQSMELFDHVRVSVMTLTKADFVETGASVNDTENLINLPMQIATVEVSALLSEPLDSGPVRVSLRSKGKLNMATFAAQFGGGGHARAAGLKFNTDLATARKQLIDALLIAAGTLPNHGK